MRCVVDLRSVRPRVPGSATNLTRVLQPIDFDGDVNLFHFVLLRCVGKGAFGKVSIAQIVSGEC